MEDIGLLPNLHLLVVYSSAVLLLAGTVFYVAGKLLATRPVAESVLQAARWDLTAGAPLAVVALVTGWLVLSGAHLDPVAQTIAELHVRAGAIGSLLAIGALVVLRQTRHAPGWIVLAVLAVGCGAVTLSAIAGAQLVHRHGVGIERQREEPRMPVAMLRAGSSAAARGKFAACNLFVAGMVAMKRSGPANSVRAKLNNLRSGALQATQRPAEILMNARHLPMVTRRGFCLGAAGLAGAAMSPAWGAAGQSGESAMLERPIPSSGERVPVIGLGTSDVFDAGPGPAERAPLAEVLKLLLDAGGKLIDTSPMYGRAEEVAGELIAAAKARQRTFIATKVWTRQGREAGLQQIETSMRLLRAQQLDLVQVHNLLGLDTHLATLRRLKEENKIRYLGITHYTVASQQDLASVLRRERLDFVQLNYSIVTRDAEQRLLPLAAERGVATLINRPFEDGALFARVRGKALPAWAAEIDCASWAQFFLKFIVSHPAVTCAIPATSKAHHMRDNLQAGSGAMPDAKMRERMAQYVASL